MARRTLWLESLEWSPQSKHEFHQPHHLHWPTVTVAVQDCLHWLVSPTLSILRSPFHCHSHSTVTLPRQNPWP